MMCFFLSSCGRSYTGNHTTHSWRHKKQESIPVGCTTPIFLIWGSPYRDPPPEQRPPAQRPSRRKEHGTRLPDRKWHHTETLPMDKMTDASEYISIILPQISFVGGNYAENIKNLCNCRQVRIDPKPTFVALHK